MYRITSYSTESPKWIKAAKLTPDTYLVISSDEDFIVQVFNDGKGEYREAKHFPSWAEAVEAYRAYLKNRLVELLGNLSHEPEDDLDGIWSLWVNEDFQYILTQGETAPAGFFLLGALQELFKEREGKPEQWAILLRKVS